MKFVINKYIMKLKSYLFLIILFLSSGILLHAQKSEINKGNKYFKQEEYFRALENYNIAKDKGAQFSVDIQKRIAYCYYYLNDIDNAFNAFDLNFVTFYKLRVTLFLR